jgi:hypothetical protein
MKTVFQNSEICHVWANNLDKNRSGRASNIFFDGFTLYSYGRHFELGKKIEVNGTLYTFVNSNSYSNSTRRHQEHLRGAVNRHENVIYLPFPQNQFFGEASAKLAVENLFKQSFEHFKAQIKARTLENEFNAGSAKLAKIAQLCELFKFPLPELSADFIEVKEKAREAREKAWVNAKKAREAREVKEQAKRLILQKSEGEKLDLWLTGDFSGQLYNLGIYLRLSKDRRTVETSHGAKVPTVEALQLLKDIRSNENVIGRQIGNFTVKETTLDHIIIGCHKITWEAIEQFEKSI